MRRKGFTLVELIIAIMIMGVLAGMMTLSPKGARQTGQKEAEKVAAFLMSLYQRADREHTGFTITSDSSNKGKLTVNWGIEIKRQTLKELTPSEECSFEVITNTYEEYKNTFNPAERYPYVTIKDKEDAITKNVKYNIKVTGADGENKSRWVFVTAGEES